MLETVTFCKYACLCMQLQQKSQIKSEALMPSADAAQQLLAVFEHVIEIVLVKTSEDWYSALLARARAATDASCAENAPASPLTEALHLVKVSCSSQWDILMIDDTHGDCLLGVWLR